MPKKTEETAAPLVPPGDLDEVRKAAAACRACELWKRGTQTVFGAGPEGARVVFVGEQPGNEEDLSGEPFVGPSGKLLDNALEAAGIERREVYVTNAVKHFKWVQRGKRRLHQKPNAKEVAACRPWLLAELERIRPRVVVCLGATAAKALLGSQFRVSRQRGLPMADRPDLAPWVMATVHPSLVLRTPDESRREAKDAFFADIAAIAPLLRG